MNKFLLSERYRLELNWQKCLYTKDGRIDLVKACFKGPALNMAERINPNDYITLDFCYQTTIIVNNINVASLHWSEVEYKNNIVFLKDAYITYNSKLKNIPKLSNKDYLVIDTSGHENSKHIYNFLYPTYVVSRDDKLYDYRNK